VNRKLKTNGTSQCPVRKKKNKVINAAYKEQNRKATDIFVNNLVYICEINVRIRMKKSISNQKLAR
jgi:hypothetical protein